MSKHPASVFDQMINDILNIPLGRQMLEECMPAGPSRRGAAFQTKIMQKVPLRYRLIALGFIKKESLSQLNEKLSQEGCAQLYSRSLWEASLIFAFLNRLSYQEWKELQDICSSILDTNQAEENYFEKQITLSELERYLESNSQKDSADLRTEHLTQVLSQKISQLGSSKKDFRQFLDSNLRSFSPVREKARYYFCKYLYFYLRHKIEDFLISQSSSMNSPKALSELSVFKGITQLKRKKMSVDEIRDFLMHTGISCREIFDNLNYFYFGYISLDWLEVLMEYYGNVDALCDLQRQKLAESLRHYDPKLKKLSDQEILSLKLRQMQEEEDRLDSIYSLDGDSRGYQRNRSGENTVRKYIKGTLDIDRTTFICFLLFFGHSCLLPKELEITPERLNTILLECGFPKLTAKQAFDSFILSYLTSSDPEDLLMEEVTRYAQNEENFFFYNMYKDSKSYEQEYKKIMGLN